MATEIFWNVTPCSVVMFIFNYALQPFKAYCAIWVRRSNFRHQASPRVSPRESTQPRKVELWARNVREFCLNAEFHVTFRDLLHAVKLRHGTDGFGRVRTHELGYQRPARCLQTTEAAVFTGKYVPTFRRRVLCTIFWVRQSKKTGRHGVTFHCYRKNLRFRNMEIV